MNDAIITDNERINIEPKDVMVKVQIKARRKRSNFYST